MMIYRFILTLFLFLFISCNNNEDLNNWENAQNLYNNQDFNNCLVALHHIVNSSDNEDYITKSLFLISEIYLNEFKNYDITIEFLNKILWDYPDSELAKRSLFTKAYINSNYIQSYTIAQELYNQFLSKYPEDDLVPSVKYELDELNKHSDTIQKLLNK
ncbi:MAG: hypothetical protein CMG14_01620 [Candidatus Marinimicrobia bacterium]|nr:hypothetical protein [Candidatus Neomarinimicrobiota bacterium]